MKTSALYKPISKILHLFHANYEFLPGHPFHTDLTLLNSTVAKTEDFFLTKSGRNSLYMFV